MPEYVRCCVESSCTDKNEEMFFEYDGLNVNLNDYSVSVDLQNVELTKKEFEILWTLVNNRKCVFTRETLLNNLWGVDYYGDGRIVDNHIKRLRAKLDQFGKRNWSIKTIRGVGYKFEVIT